MMQTAFRLFAASLLLLLTTACGPSDPALASVDEFIAMKDLDTTSEGWRTILPKPPQLEFGMNSRYLWHLETNHGPVTLALWPDAALMHVSSTIFLTRVGFYDGLTFHRVIPGFMAQGGCPIGDGNGGPGYQYAGEFYRPIPLGRAGLLAMANIGQPNTDGSQFFITYAPTTWLSGKHTVFGEVIEGMDNLKKIEALGSPSGETSEPVIIESASIEVAR